MIVSIVTLTFNRVNYSSKYLPYCIDRIGDTPHEVLVWDNCSTDGTLDWLLNYAETRDNIKVFAGEQNHGMEAINFLALEAKGKYILKIDDDIQVPNNFAKRLVDAYEYANEEKLLFLGWDTFWGEKTFATRSGLRLYKEKQGKIINLPTHERVLINYHPNMWMVNGICRLSPREAFLKIGGHPPGIIYGVDKHISKRAAKNGYWIGFLNSPDLVFHRGANDSPAYREFKDRELARIGSPRHV